ncbi:MAG TPA: potassium-transporting ATPase subunit C [Pirellulales bacterium]|jgi:K+-transporting ATPase ATPase C chain|nr:potassium-transporting ATPase subunit C [Pirellulales bacterium]
MIQNLRANLWLIVLSLLMCCVLYPLMLLAVGQIAFSTSAEGSLIVDRNGQTIGSRLIAQPFSGDQYFQPRPSAASYNAAASGASNWGASNPQLRDRVAQSLGPIVKYAAGPNKDKLVGPDIEAWFKKDRFQDKPGIVAQWADAHNTTAQNWVGTTFDPKSPTLQQQYVLDWEKTRPADIARFKKDNPDKTDPAPSDLAIVFFKSLSKEHPGTFPSAQDHTVNGKTEKQIALVSEGSDVQSWMFDMWLEAHPDAELQQVPGDLVMASGSGLDPDITLDGAEYQLDRVGGEWTKRANRDVRGEIEAMLQDHATAPLGGLVGGKLINVLEMNLALRDRYEPAGPAAK